MTLCVYAIVSPPPARLLLAGIAGERLHVVAVDRMGAVVGELRRRPAPSIRNLRTYATIVDALAARASAILPARFGTTVADRDEVTLILRSRRASLRARLRAVRGRTQMTIRLVPGSDPDDDSDRGQTLVTGHARVRPPYGATQGTEYLRGRGEMAARAKDVPAFEPVRAAIRRYVKDERVEKRSGVVTINHLIPRAAARKYGDAVARAAAEHGLRLIVSGPWPPYAFADTW